MSAALWSVLHLAGDAALLYAAGRSAFVAYFWRRSRRHDACMARIAQLEVACGVGLDWAKEWFQAQPVRGKNKGYDYIAELHCYGCGTTYGRNGSRFTKLCPACRTKVAA